MQAFTFIFFSLTLSYAITFANGQVDSTKCLNEYDKEISAKAAEVTNIKLTDQEEKNSKQDLIGSALSGLVQFLNIILIPTLTAILNLVPSLLKDIKITFDGFSKDGLIGLLGGLAESITTEFRNISSKIAENLFKVSDPAQNEIIKKNIQDALSFAKAKQDERYRGRSGVDANLNRVNDLVVFVLNFAYSLLKSYLTIVGSAITSLIKKLLGGLEKHGLIGGLSDGLFGGLKSTLDSLGTATIKSAGGIFRNTLVH